MKKIHIISFLILFISALLAFEEGYCMDRLTYSCLEHINILSKDDSCKITDATLLNEQQIAVSLTNGSFSIININPLSACNFIPMSSSKLIGIDSIQTGSPLATIDKNAHVVLMDAQKNTVQSYSSAQIFSEERSDFAQGYGSLCLLENGNIVVKQKFDTEQACFAGQGTLLSFIDTKEEVVKHKIAPVYPIDKIISLPGDRCLALVNKQALQIFDFTKKEIVAPIVFEFSEQIIDFSFIQDPLSKEIAIVAISRHGLLTFLELLLHKKIEKTEAKFIGEKKTKIKNIGKIIPLIDANIIFVQKNKKIYIFNVKKNKVLQKIDDTSGEIVSVLPFNNGSFIVVYQDGRVSFFEKTEKRLLFTVKRTTSINPLMSECSLQSSNAIFFHRNPNQEKTEKLHTRALSKEEEKEESTPQEIFHYQGKIKIEKTPEKLDADQRVNLTVKRIESIDFSDKNELHGAKNDNDHLKGTRFFTILTPLVEKEDKESAKSDKKEEIIQSKRKIKIIRIDSDARKSEKTGDEGEEPRLKI